MKKNFKKQKNNSILSFALAVLFFFSWNYSPISLVSKRLAEMNKTSAYSSSTTQTYYGLEDVAVVTTESNISNAYLTDGTDKYFSDSSNNYNILNHYSEMYEDLFKKYADEYLVALDNDENQYNGMYSKYLKHVGYSSASAYYTAKSSSLTESSFKEYFENLTTKNTTWTVEGATEEENEQFTLESIGTKSELYNGFANYLTGEQKPNEDGNLSADDADFYTKSVSYLRVKTSIDGIISKTTVVYSYDGKTQTDYVGAIIAKNAPISQAYYYESDKFEQLVETNLSFVNTTYTPLEGAGIPYDVKQVYYFGQSSDITNLQSFLSWTEHKTIKTLNSVDSIQDDFDTNTFDYRLIMPGEFGYLDASHPTYYKYSQNPYEKTNSGTTIYVVDDNVTPDEKATYDSLHFIQVITSEELAKDQANKLENDTTGCFYVQIPYTEAYFSKIFSTAIEVNYENAKNLFTKKVENETVSNIYFKVSSSYSNSSNIVYIDQNDWQSFTEDYSGYNHHLAPVSAEELTNLDYLKVSASYTNFYIKDYTLYFKQIRKELTNTTVAYDGTYETVPSTNLEYETATVASEKYENFNIYALVDALKVGDTTYKVVSSDFAAKSLYEAIPAEEAPSTEYTFYYKHTLTSDGKVDNTAYETENDEKVIYVSLAEKVINGTSYTVITTESLEEIRNLYAPVPASVYETVFGEEETSPLYYKHTTKTVKQLYVVDDSETAKENEVYKNLNYKVLSNEEFNNKYFYFVEVTETDKNYNSNFKLYYKLSNIHDDAADYAADSNLFIQNIVTGRNAIYIIDDSLTTDEINYYKGKFYSVLSQTDFNAESDKYVLISSLDTDHYDTTYTKLYYKYRENTTSTRRIYVYSSSESKLYTSFYNTDTNYLASDYELIEATDPNYVAGTNLYYKKNRVETVSNTEKSTYYYYKTTSTVTLSANSYYAISFYVYTNGNHYDENNNLVEGNVQASVYITDTKNVISNISIEHIDTNGKWQKYVAFVETDTIATSTISFALYMGDKNSVAGNYNYESNTVSGTVMFDEIKVTLIGETDYSKHSIDGNSVLEEVVEYDTETEQLPVLTATELTGAPAGTYKHIEDTKLAEDRILDSNNVYYYKHVVDTEGNVTEEFELDELQRNKVYVYVASNSYESETKAVTVKTTSHTYTNVDAYKNHVVVIENDNLAEGERLNNKHKNNAVISNWNNNFNFDNSETLNDRINSLTFAGNEDGYTENNDWHYYISRNTSGQGNKELLESYQNAYSNKKLTATVVAESTIDKTEKEEDKEEDKTETVEDLVEKELNKDVPTTESTFISSNNVLKLANSDKLKSLGVVSTPFTVNQLEYYKVTVWIYSPDKDATATLKLESILYTSNTSNQGTLLSSTASNVKAHLADYEKAPTNEYSWIPVSFFVEGNAFSSMDVKLVLLADPNSTVYFDNITIEKVTSSTYDSANSDSDVLTYCLSLSPSTSLISSGVTNGYFNLMTFTNNYNVNIDYSLPRNAENWTAVTDNSTSVVAGVVATSRNDFFNKYNGEQLVNVNGANIYAIHAPKKITSPLDSTLEKEYTVNHNYKIYSSSLSLSASSVYAVSFEFLAGYEFNGKLVSNIYSGSVASANIVSSMNISSENIAAGWNTYTFYIETSTESATIYLEIGVEEATGTCFFQKVKNIKSSETTVDAVRDNLVKNENVATTNVSLDEYAALNATRFVKLNDKDFSIHTDVKNDYELYDSKNFKDTNVNDSTFTVGKSGTAVASYYTTNTSTYYTVEIKSIDYIKANGESKEIATDEDNTFYVKEFTQTNEETAETTTTYKLYSDSMFTVEVLGFDVSGNGKIEDEELNNFTITKSASTVKVTLDGTDNSAKTVTENEYEYKFNNDVVVNNVVIPASELNNNYSQNVLILANSTSSDFTSLSNLYKYSLASSSFYAIKIYVKTSDLGDNGLNIAVDSVTVNWNNINTTKSTNADENGFVCYELWVKTNTSSFSKVTLTLSLGEKGKSAVGYALVAGVDVEKFSSETLFNEYCNAKEELYKENDENSIAKRYFGTESSSDNKDDKKEDDSKSSTTWATFFYILSSLLLGVVLIMALVAAIIRRHPIKKAKRVKDDSFVIVEQNKEKSKKTSKAAKEEKTETAEEVEPSTEETPAETAETTEEAEEPSNEDTQGF